ncbi:MAG: aminopeptidase [Lachnospiraceae bacterium]|nr:aminopeptidase [Lachnospiraceae bacterium]
MKERWELTFERIEEIKQEAQLPEPFLGYAVHVASFLRYLAELCKGTADRDVVSKEAYAIWNKENVKWLYADVEGEAYERCYANPAYSKRHFGLEMGQFLAFLYAEIRAAIGAAAQGDAEEILIRAELFVQIYCILLEHADAGATETIAKAAYPECKDALYWFISDYYEIEAEKRVADKVDPSRDFATKIVMTADLNDPSYLYRYGEYISENEIKISKYLSELPEETIAKMADTYTEGYRVGFEKTGKDLSKKSVVNIVYPIGFERVIRRAIGNFEKMNLRPTLMRTTYSVFYKRARSVINGYYGTRPNRQYDYDHREDDALFLDGNLTTRKLETLQAAYEQYKDLAKEHAGPAWMDTFGEADFEPVDKPAALKYDEHQKKLSVRYASESGELINTYIPGEERSFTIIAFPIPEIGADFEAIMNETIAVNTLDSLHYEGIQQHLIDALDTCDYVRVLGRNGNHTDLKVELCKLNDRDKETKFENCVADVNIPVGEVFTSPALSGTEGVLHVTKVYLEGLSYDNLELTFADGMVTGYDCKNFAEEESNKRFIEEHILYHHKSIPMGEFAIGTNTTAYVMGRKFGIERKLPILIAEKTGPHFAVGDTCYSYAEDVAVYNPDGKEIIARDNACSLLRKDEKRREEAYFHCHTDITIPYDELGRLYGVRADGSEVDLIVNGRFVLPGTEELNGPLDTE